MLLYCLKCRKNIGNKNPEVVRTKKWKINDFIKMGVIVKNRNISKSKNLADY